MRTSIRTGAAIAALTLVATTVAPTGAGAQDGQAHGASPHTTAALDRATFHDAMRELWEDHITWTRLYIISAATGPADLPDIGPTTDRLLANQSDIGDAIRPFYGDEAGDALTELLRDHILTAAEIIAEAKGGDAEARDEAIARWYVNGDEIAAFLSAADPEHWPLDAMATHMKSHLDLTLEDRRPRRGPRRDDARILVRGHQGQRDEHERPPLRNR